MLLPETEQVAVPPSTKEAPGIDALPSILLPLAGPEEYDLDVGFKQISKATFTDVVRFTLQDLEKLPASLQLPPSDKRRERDETLRLTHIETLLLLCTTRWGRDYLRNNGVYEVTRVLHSNEKAEQARFPPAITEVHQ